MTAFRGSVVWKLESTIGQEAQGTDFEYLSPATDFNYSMNNNIKYSYTVGSKSPDIATAGRFSGTWSVNTILDYNHFKWLLVVFEDYSYNTTTHIHTFKKSNTKKLRTFTMQVKKLNRIVGGTKDQTIKLLGCVADTLRVSYESASTSTVKCTISGKYMKEKVSLADLTQTDYDTVEPTSVPKIPIEWGCLQLSDDGNTFSPVANNERTSFSLSSTVSLIPSCGTRFDSDFYEGQTNKISVEMSVYSRDPTNYLRVYNGGESPGVLSTATEYEPRAKMLKPLNSCRIASSYTNSTANKEYECTATFFSAYFESMGQTYNANSEIVDKPSISAMKMELKIKSADVQSALIS